MQGSNAGNIALCSLRLQSDRILVASTDDVNPNVEERQRFKDFEDQLIDILLVLDTTSDTIKSLLEKCKQFRRDIGNMPQSVEDDSYDSLECALLEKQRDVQSSRRKVETIHNKVQGTTDLASSILREMLNNMLI